MQDSFSVVFRTCSVILICHSEDRCPLSLLSTCQWNGFKMEEVLDHSCDSDWILELDGNEFTICQVCECSF